MIADLSLLNISYLADMSFRRNYSDGQLLKITDYLNCSDTHFPPSFLYHHLHFGTSLLLF